MLTVQFWISLYFFSAWRHYQSSIVENRSKLDLMFEAALAPEEMELTNKIAIRFTNNWKWPPNELFLWGSWHIWNHESFGNTNILRQHSQNRWYLTGWRWRGRGWGRAWKVEGESKKEVDIFFVFSGWRNESCMITRCSATKCFVICWYF